METGYFSELDATFKSTTDEIQSNYLKKTAMILKDCQNPPYISYKNDKYIIKEMLKVVNAYQMLEKEDERVRYLNRVRLRSLSSQYLQISPLLNDGFFFPFYIFIVRDKDE